MEELFTKLYENSAFTFEGLSYDSFVGVQDEINEFLDEQGCGRVPRENFYAYTGKDMNEYYNLTGNNKYPDDLSFVSFLLDGLNISRLAFVKLNIGARWFDDIVDNNERRELCHGVH